MEVVTAGQDRPPHAAHLLLGTVHRKLVETLQGEELLLWHWEETRREALEEDFIMLVFIASRNDPSIAITQLGRKGAHDPSLTEFTSSVVRLLNKMCDVS